MNIRIPEREEVVSKLVCAVLSLLDAGDTEAPLPKGRPGHFAYYNSVARPQGEEALRAAEEYLAGKCTNVAAIICCNGVPVAETSANGPYMEVMRELADAHFRTHLCGKPEKPLLRRQYFNGHQWSVQLVPYAEKGGGAVLTAEGVMEPVSHDPAVMPGSCGECPLAKLSARPCYGAYRTHSCYAELWRHYFVDSKGSEKNEG